MLRSLQQPAELLHFTAQGLSLPLHNPMLWQLLR
jgi:hypothetical protein